ncbi:MAG TPA: ubiquitin-like domain-containing protein [Candidatus Saccharibacteria bacterium]|nr:ubiquitin-like domain-containing protein [Candidatus Saccharibacteria bacterium]
MLRKNSKKPIISKQKRRKIQRVRKHPFVVPVITFIVLFFGTIVLFISFNSTTVAPGDQRIVNVFVDDQKQTLPTRAPTVGELLKRMDVTLNEGDQVEPKASTQILEDDFTVNVYRARPVTVIDGKKITTVLSAQQSARAVAEEVGVKVYPEDDVRLKVPDDLLKEGVIAEKVVIKRSIPVSLVLYGQTYSVRTLSKTVGELVEEKGLDTDEVTVFPPAETKLKPNTVVYVTYPGKKIITKSESIPFKEKRVEDPDLDAGETVVKREGEKGKKVVIYEVDKTNPKKKKALKTVIAKKPIDRIIAVGTGSEAELSLPGGAVSGSKLDWMKAAGIDPSQYQYVDYIIGRESGWNPASVSANRCIGLGQKCDASSLISACPNWQSDPVCQLNHFSGYANGRYGSWQGAYSAWQAQGWW